MPSEVKMIACHFAGKSGRGLAACFMTLDAARDMVEAGQAVWNKRGTYINFTKLEASIAPTAHSLKMDADIIEKNAMGDVGAMALVAGWSPRYSFGCRAA